jgi:transposase
MSESATVTSAYAPDVDDVRRWLEKMIKAMRLVELVAAIIALVTRMRDINTELTKRLADARRKRPRSETLGRVEAQLIFAFGVMVPLIREPGATLDEGTGGVTVPDPSKKKRKRGRHPGRAALPKELERVPEVNLVPPSLRACPLCGATMTTVSHSLCEILDVRPAQLYVRQRMDETVACPNDDTIVSAPTPPAIVERGKLGDTLIVESLADKYIEHQPVERQCLRWSRTGVDIAPQTLGRGIAKAIDLLSPVAKAIEARTRSPGLLATDATGIPVLDQDAPDGIRNGTMWCWTNARWVTFFYSATGDSDSVRRFLGDELRRSVQCDGTNITTFVERAGGQRPGCWSHGRRRLVEAARGGDKVALEALRIIARLFVVERQSAEAGETAAQRFARRQTLSRPIIDELRLWLDEKKATAPPKTPLGKALGYLDRQWRRLLLFLGNGNVELTNNRVERELRKLVLGRRNWLFTWEDLGGQRTAQILTIVGTCIAHEINPRAYLHLVTKMLVYGWPQSRLRDLLPDHLAVKHPELLLRDDDVANYLPEIEKVARVPAFLSP